MNDNITISKRYLRKRLFSVHKNYDAWEFGSLDAEIDNLIKHNRNRMSKKHRRTIEVCSSCNHQLGHTISCPYAFEG